MKLSKLVLTDTGQFVLGFYPAHTAALRAERERMRRFKAEQAAQRRRERRGVRHTLDLMELPEDYLTAEELAKCNEYLETAKQSIQAGWTREQEAAARGVDIRKCARLFCYDGRLFQDAYTIPSVSLGDLWMEGEGDE